MNLYAYVINNPIASTDPRGLQYEGPTINHGSVIVKTLRGDDSNRTLGFKVEGGQGLSSVEVVIGVGQAPARGQGGLGPFTSDPNSEIRLPVRIDPGTGVGYANNVNISSFTGGGESYLQIEINYQGAPTAHLTNFPNDPQGRKYPIGLCGGQGAPSCRVLQGYGGPDASKYVEPGTSKSQR